MAKCDQHLCLSNRLIDFQAHRHNADLLFVLRTNRSPQRPLACSAMQQLSLFTLHSPASSSASTQFLCLESWQPHSHTGDNQSPLQPYTSFHYKPLLSPSNLCVCLSVLPHTLCVCVCWNICVHCCHLAISQHPFIASPTEMFCSMPVNNRQLCC